MRSIREWKRTDGALVVLAVAFIWVWMQLSSHGATIPAQDTPTTETKQLALAAEIYAQASGAFDMAVESLVRQAVIDKTITANQGISLLSSYETSVVLSDDPNARKRIGQFYMGASPLVRQALWQAAEKVVLTEKRRLQRERAAFLEQNDAVQRPLDAALELLRAR